MPCVVGWYVNKECKPFDSSMAHACDPGHVRQRVTSGADDAANGADSAEAHGQQATQQCLQFYQCIMKPNGHTDRLVWAGSSLITSDDAHTVIKLATNYSIDNVTSSAESVQTDKMTRTADGCVATRCHHRQSHMQHSGPGIE